jgi:short-subunit dehydrogenase
VAAAFDSAAAGAYALDPSMNPLELRGRWVLVTGASSGLGREMAKILAGTYGANLLLVARREDRLRELQSELQARGVKVDVCVADLSKLEDVDRVIEVATTGRELYGAAACSTRT